MQVLITFYPAVVTLLAMFFYKRDTMAMQLFYRRMTFSKAARQLFVMTVIVVLLAFNFTYLQSVGVNWALLLASVGTLSLFSFPVANWFITRMQAPESIGLAFLAVLSCVFTAQIWPVSMFIFMLTAASVFYPSRNLLKKLTSPDYFSKVVSSSGKPLIEEYYQR